MRLVRTICPYCGVGCSFDLIVNKDKVIGVRPWKQDPVSQGAPCIKGLNCYETIYAKDRIKKPMIRKKGKLVPVSWEEAYKYIHKNISKLKPSEIGFYGSGSATNEDNYLLQKFAREVFKTENIDSSARLCHATTCYAFKESFGIAAMPSKIEDFEWADCILVIGSNPRATYPVAFNKILKAKKQGAKLICVRDWKDETSQLSDFYVEIIDGTQLPFLNCVLNLLKTKSPKNVKKYTKEKVAKICGTTPEKIQKVANLVAKSKKFVLCFGMGMTQHSYGVDNVFSAINLVLAKKGKIISMRGKTNIQGCGDMGINPGKKGETITSSVFVDNVKALYLMGSNIAQSLPDLNKAHKSLKKMFIVQHAEYPNLTTEFANIVLPSCSWSETDGTFTNAESRVRFTNRAINPQHDSKENWRIILELAKYFNKNYDYKNALDIFKEIKKNIKGYKSLKDKQFVNRPIKFKKFHPAEFKGLEEPTSKKYPYVLTTERTMYQFCTGDLSQRSKSLNKLMPKPLCLISKEDAKALKIKTGNVITITSKVGKIKIKAKVEDNVPKNLLLVPFHFKESLVNKLIPLKYGKRVEEPNLKRVAVNIKK